MKKQFLLILLGASLLFSFNSCKKEKAAEQSRPNVSKIKTSQRTPVNMTMNDNRVSFSSMEAFFKPDYTAEYPDEEEAADKIKESTKSKKTKESTSFIPKLRKLEDYKTQYSAQKKKFAPVQTEQKISDINEDFSDQPFNVQDWGPRNNLVSEAEYPSFYVVFSQPVKALTALPEPSSTSDVVSISPQLKGTFHWYGTQNITFEAEEASDPSVVYTIKVNSNLKSIYGNSINGPVVFQTEAEPVQIYNIYGGYIKERDCAYDNTSGALPPYENRVFVRTNYLLKADSFKNKLLVYVGDTVLNSSEYTVEADFTNKTFSWWNNEPQCDNEKQTSNSFVVTINSTVPHNTIITLKTADDSQKFTYKTLQPFDRVRIDDYTNYTEGKMGNPLYIELTQATDVTNVINYVHVRDKDDNKIYLTKDNIELNGRYLTIHSLPLELDTEYKLFIMSGFKDKYGQIYCGGEYNYYYTFRTRPVQAYVKYQDYGVKMMEAQYPHTLIYEHQNIIAGSYYKVRQFQNPLNISTNNLIIENETTVERGPENQRHFEVIDLNPYLTNGYGFIRFDAKTRFKGFDYWSDEQVIKEESNVLTVQVTDLGITTRMGINRAVVMVRSLSRNEPVANADVYILNECSEYTDDPLNHIIAQGKTNDQGLAVINYTEDQILAYENNSKYEYTYKDNLTVFVQNGDDKAIFTPTSHNSWRDGVSTALRHDARKAFQRTFMFVDRGVYRPGETVTFRGIDRDQVLGSLIPHKGSYTISVEKSGWSDEKMIDPMSGSLSDTGGFYGSFKIPDEQEPGYYSIKFKRDDAKDKYDYEKINFQIAEFERVKSAASITVPEITYYNGDSLSVQLSAEYLAGGALSGAAYDSTWYKQVYDVEFTSPETKGYSFGTDTYSYRMYYSEARGKLDGEGKATLICNSEKTTDGLSYIYRAEAAVTDISNQRVSTANSLLVHPAKFYIGLKKGAGFNGFAKTKTKLEFPYILTDVKGNSLQTASQIVSAIDYTLTREEWTMVHEQSVYDTIYTRYERQDIEEAAGKVDILSKGTLSLTPENSGWYTLKLSGTDKDGRLVVTSLGFYVTGGSAYRYNNYNSESITLTPDQSQYNPGDTAQILMESPLPAGDYLITVEREGIFTEEIRHFDSPANVIEVPVASNFVPVFYVAVSSYSVRSGEPTHQYGEPDMDKPKGYFGVTPVFVNPYVRAFSVTVETDKPSYRPGENATITLTATKGGKALSNAELTVMAVDRGVLDIINYHVPNPIDYFYSSYNYPLRVKGGDSRALLMDPVTYSIKDLQGGDSDEEKDEDERKDFRPTAVFEPVLITDKNGKATVTFKVPDSLTTYRITAFGAKDDLFALKENEFTVQNPINVQQVQPRLLRERDTAECGVLITNLDAQGHEVTITLETRTPTKNTTQDEQEGRKTIPGEAFVDGENEHKVYVAPGDSSVVYFNVAAKTRGTVELVYTVESDILNEKLNSPIKIEKTFTYETVASYGTIDNDKAKGKTAEQIAIPGFTEEGRGDLSVTIDATRLGVLGGAVNYLFDYPYGCLEQQSSRILPLIAFGEYIDVFGLDSQIADTKKLVKTYLSKWGKYQLDNGGFPYWPAGEYASLYVSMRMAYIYYLGLERGYTDDDFGYDINKLLDYIQGEIKASGSYTYNDYNKAYAALILSQKRTNYALTLLDSLYDHYKELSLSAEALVALGYLSIPGNSAKAQTLADDIRQYLQPDGRSVSVLRKTRISMWDWYNSDAEQLALIMQLFTTLNAKDGMIDKLLYTLLQNQSHGYWQNTASTSRVLEAMYAYIKGRKLDDTNYTAKATLAGTNIMSQSFQGAAAKPKTLKLPFEDEIIAKLQKDKAQDLVFEKDGPGNLYYTVEMRYAVPDEYLIARNEGFKVIYTITDSETGEIVNTAKDTDCLLKLESGKIYKASIRLESPKSHDYVALRAPIPSGAEILDSSLVITGTLYEERSGDWRHCLDNKTIRDNEVQFFWDSFGSGSTTVNFTFRASRRGIYPVPPVQAECMYEPETFGRGDGYLCIIE